jgi:uncharacterized repeat protein (TIGR03803 family)
VFETCTLTSDGTAFKISLAGTLTTLHDFGSPSGDGAGPAAALVQATDWSFYGTTRFGGSNCSGAIFRITPKGKLTTLYSFCSQRSCAAGYDPVAGLALGTDGNLYGTTSQGGANGYGAVFKITPSGTLTTLHTFTGYPTDGAWPFGNLIQATDGNFYGTTYFGGAYDDCESVIGGCGTVFKMSPEGTLTTLYSFCAMSQCDDGNFPYAGLVQAADGNFYGTAFYGGSMSDGTVFKITPAGILTVLHAFDGSDGAQPSIIIQGINGSFYGITTEYGSPTSCTNPFYGCGTVFGLSVGLAQFVRTLPTFGEVAQHVIILGTDLEGATSVTFNGAAATFTIRSASAIETNVPVGATTGPVQVVSPSRTLTSNVSFQVLP